jgi:hypothetical protein
MAFEAGQACSNRRQLIAPGGAFIPIETPGHPQYTDLVIKGFLS